MNSVVRIALLAIAALAVSAAGYRFYSGPGGCKKKLSSEIDQVQHYANLAHSFANRNYRVPTNSDIGIDSATGIFIYARPNTEFEVIFVAGFDGPWVNYDSSVKSIECGMR